MFTIAIVKVLNMKNFKKERVFDVFTEIIENLNFPYPHTDWDVEKQSTVDEYKQKLKEVNIEMRWSFGINIFFNVLMFMPLWWTVYNITERHQLLEETVLAREDETEAYNRAQYLNNCLTSIFLTALVLEAASFYFYMNKVKIYIYKQEDIKPLEGL